MSTTTGSSCQSASISATASSACERDSATTAATASPCQQARPMAIGYCAGDLMPFRCASTATQGLQYSAILGPSKTARTPGDLIALSNTNFLIRACAYGLLKN